MKKFTYDLSIIILSLTILSCKYEIQPTPNQKNTTLQATNARITNNIGVIETTYINKYLDYIIARVLVEQAKRPIILNTNKPLAFSTGPGFILISKGLIISLPNEAALAFVIAHEFAHSLLGHFTNFKEDNRYKFEIDADLEAIKLLIEAGYDPRVSAFTLQSNHRGFDSTRYPNFEVRLNQINQYLIKTNWTPPGTINRRGFSLLKNELFSY